MLITTPTLTLTLTLARTKTSSFCFLLSHLSQEFSVRILLGGEGAHGEEASAGAPRGHRINRIGDEDGNSDRLLWDLPQSPTQAKGPQH